MKKNIIEVKDVKFGKNTLHSLTIGMYVNPFFLFREYVQNSADAIQDAIEDGIIEQHNSRILITLNYSDRSIIIQDNGIGLQKDVSKDYLVNVGDSKKDTNKRMGRFGIGRLGGLGYCDKLRFETSAKGDSYKTIVEWDAKRLTELINDSSVDDDAPSVIKKVVSCTEEKCETDAHFFKVSLEGVKETHSDLLDERKVGQYLSQVAPVPFRRDNFRFADKIYKFLEDNELPVNDYNVVLNDEPIFKPYEDSIPNVTKNPDNSRDAIAKAKPIKVEDVLPQLIKNVRGEILGWFWIALTNCEGRLGKYCISRGIRLRQWNIQIGDADCLNKPKFWREELGNSYFIGEIYALDNNLIPTPRRDYFEENEACRGFEELLKSIFDQLNDVFRAASTINSGNKKAEIKKNLEKRINEDNYLEDDKEDRENDRRELDKANKNYEKAIQERRKLTEKYHLQESNAPKKTEEIDGAEIASQELASIYVDHMLRSKPLPVNTLHSEKSAQETSTRKKSSVAKQSLKKAQKNNIHFNNGEKHILKIVKEVLKNKLSDPMFKDVWYEITRNLINLDGNE